MNPALQHSSCTEWTNEAELLQLLLELRLAQCADVEVAGGQRTHGVKLRRRAADQDRPLEPAPVHRLAGAGEQAQRGFELGAVGGHRALRRLSHAKAQRRQDRQRGVGMGVPSPEFHDLDAMGACRLFADTPVKMGRLSQTPTGFVG